MNKSEPLAFDTLRRFVIANYVTLNSSLFILIQKIK
jgi:hypothetical protein